MIGILHHPKVPAAEPLASEIQDWLVERQHRAWESTIGTDINTLVRDSELLIALGGDGSILHTARLGAMYNVPIFSVNLGRLGFLSEASPMDWKERLTTVLAGEHRLERRLMIEAFIERNGEIIGSEVALNEIVVSRGRQARVLYFNLSVADELVTSIVADGIIVATASGSTAYALAAGGPILPPELPNFVVVPVAPHLSLDRPIVLYEEDVVMIEVKFDHEATVTADGVTPIDLMDGDRIIVKRAPYTSFFTRIEPPSYFFRRLLDRGVVLRRN